MEAIDREAELLAATVGAGETEVTDRSALLAAWRTFFEIAARRAPLVLVFEDLHWSSDSLLDLFEFVMQPRGDLPLLMIALSRPELLDRRPGWGGGRRNYTSISLEPLSDRETAQLVERLLEGCPAELVDRIVRHAEGNPFFAGELIRSVAERAGGDQLPDTVQATVLARLDLLAPEQRRIIQLGSVFGRAFRPPGLLALEPTLQGVQQLIDQLTEKDLLRSTGSDIFAFRHILIREVAYQTLTRAERGRLHAAAAAWLEGLAGEREDSLAELIAYHYREAATMATAQRPGEAETERIRRKAVDWLGLAAYHGAEGFFPFWIRAAGRLATPAEIAEADASAERALDIGRRLDDPNLQSMALDALAGTGQIQDDWRRSREYSRQRLAFQDRLELFEKVDAHSMVAWSSALLGDLDEAERVSAEGLAQVQPGQVPAVTLHLVAWRTYTLTLLGRWDDAIAMAHRARQLLIASGQSSAGYALRGFMAAVDVARARQDERLVELFGVIHDDISAAFPKGTDFGRWLGYGKSNLQSCQDAVEHFLLEPRLQMERLERGLSMLLDQDRLPSTAGLLSVLELCRRHEYPLLEAQAERALGRAKREPSRLNRSISLFDRSGARPYAARVRCELALITGDHIEMEAGLQVLEQLGDAEQVARFERLQVG